MNKKIWIVMFMLLMLGSFTSAWTSSDFTLDKDKQIELNSKTNYGTYEIKESAWYDPLKIWTEETVKSIELKTNTEQCVDCLSEGTIVLNKKQYSTYEVEWENKCW